MSISANHIKFYTKIQLIGYKKGTVQIANCICTKNKNLNNFSLSLQCQTYVQMY